MFAWRPGAGSGQGLYGWLASFSPSR